MVGGLFFGNYMEYGIQRPKRVAMVWHLSPPLRLFSNQITGGKPEHATRAGNVPESSMDNLSVQLSKSRPGLNRSAGSGMDRFILAGLHQPTPII